MAHDALLVFCSCPDEATAAEIARRLVGERLAACANRLPGVVSSYVWENQLAETPEVLLLIKTRAAVYPALETRIADLHPYELPEIVAVPISVGLPGYLDWIKSSVADSDGSQRG